MACKNVCRLCKRLVLSQAVTYADGVLTVNLPDGSYAEYGSLSKPMRLGSRYLRSRS